MIEMETGDERFVEVTLQPRFLISRESDVSAASALHHKARELCFIAKFDEFFGSRRAAAFN